MQKGHFLRLRFVGSTEQPARAAQVFQLRAPEGSWLLPTGSWYHRGDYLSPTLGNYSFFKEAYSGKVASLTSPRKEGSRVQRTMPSFLARGTGTDKPKMDDQPKLMYLELTR